MRSSEINLSRTNQDWKNQAKLQRKTTGTYENKYNQNTSYIRSSTDHRDTNMSYFEPFSHKTPPKTPTHENLKYLQSARNVKIEKNVFPSPTVVRTSDPRMRGINTGIDSHAKELFFGVLEHSCTKENYLQVLDRLKLIKEKFYDAEFPPEWSSLYGYGESNSSIDLALWKRFTWKRCKDIFLKKKVKIFSSEEIKPSDVIQGYLGDCYFLSTIAAISETPSRIKKIFRSKKVNSEKCYSVKVYVTGVLEEIILDDFIPFYEPEGKPAFTRTISSAIWVLLLEKAWAKIHGGYLNINSGLVKECLRDFTGAPTKTYFINNPKLWEEIIKGEKYNFIMTAGSSREAGKDILSSIGLVGSHSYTILGGIEVFTESYGQSRKATKKDSRKDRRYRRLVKLRNPWGRGEWKGDWSYNSHLWSDKLKKELGFRKEDDGIFFMDFNDFKKYFSDVQICYYHDEYKYESEVFEYDDEEEFYVRLMVPKEGIYYVSLNQTSKRTFPKSSPYEYSSLTLVLARILPNGNFEYIQGAQKSDRELFVKFQCSKPGNYLVYIKTNWKTNIRKFSLSAYGPEKPVFKHISELAYEDGLSLNKIYKDRARKWSKPFKTFEEYGEPDIKYFFDETSDGFGYFYFVNSSKEKTRLMASVILKKMKNIELVKPHFGSKADIDLPADHDEIVMYRVLQKPASLNYVVAPRFRKNPEVLKRLAFEKGKTSPRPQVMENDEEIEVGIKVYMYRTQDGLVMLYKNDSLDKKIDEKIKFVLEGCSVLGSANREVEISVNPREEKMIQILRDEDASYFRIKMEDMKYKISDV